MHSHRRFLTQHRLQRLILWTLTLLTWFASILSNTRAVSTRHQSQRFDISLPWLTQLVGNLLILRAAHLARRRPRRIQYWRHGRSLRPRHLNRSALGARLRRALRHKDTATWIANLIAVLRNLDTHAAQLAHRLRRGLTRVWGNAPPIAPCVAHFGAPASPPAFSDSS